MKHEEKIISHLLKLRNDDEYLLHFVKDLSQKLEEDCGLKRKEAVSQAFVLTAYRIEEITEMTEEELVSSVSSLQERIKKAFKKL